MRQIFKGLGFIAVALFVQPVNARICFPEFANAFKHGSPELKFRLRQEDSRQAGLDVAYATTLRTTVGFETAEFYRSIFKVELVDVSHFFGMHYNPAVSDLSLPQYTVISDPPGAGITEVKVAYNGFERNVITFGRQYLMLDNQRFIGPNDFRQYPQSFDSLSWDCNMIPNLDFFYAYVYGVETNFGNGRANEGYRRLTTNLINIDWSGAKFGRIGGYAYFNNDHSLSINSNTTIGARIHLPEDLCDPDNFAYLFEIAWQKGHFNNPSRYSASYMHIWLSKAIECMRGTLGYERLGGNAHAANQNFIAPMGSVSNFNGEAEVWTILPGRGLQDAYATLAGRNYNFSAGITFHFFMLDKGAHKQAGQEIDLYASYKITEQFDLSITYATYSAKNNVAPNTKRFWVMLTANLL